jgi:HEAT repeats
MRALLIVTGVLLLGACRDPGVQSTFDPKVYEDPAEAKKVHALIQRMQAFEQADADPGKEADYVKVRDELIPKGNVIQPQLIEALNGDPSWGVRYGAIEVLNAVGDKKCVDSLIAALTDAHPQVGLMSLYLLRQLTAHRIVPETGTSPEGIPAVPRRGEGEALGRDYELWVQWRDRHGPALQRAWRDWWEVNKNKVLTK